MRTTVVCTCNGELHRRHCDVKLVENVAGSCDEVLELSGGLRWVRCRVLVNPSVSAKMCTETVTATAFGWNGDGFTEQCPWLKGFCFVRPRLVGPGVVIVARTNESKYVSTSRLLFDGKQYSSTGKRSSGALDVAPRRSTDNPRTLVQCKKWWWTHATSCKEGSKSRGRRAGTGKTAWTEKTVSKGALTQARASSKFLQQATRGIGGLQRCHLLFRCYRKLRQF